MFGGTDRLSTSRDVESGPGDVSKKKWCEQRLGGRAAESIPRPGTDLPVLWGQGSVGAPQLGFSCRLELGLLSGVRALSGQDSAGFQSLCGHCPIPRDFPHLCLPDTTSPFLVLALTQHGPGPPW